MVKKVEKEGKKAGRSKKVKSIKKEVQGKKKINKKEEKVKGSIREDIKEHLKVVEEKLKDPKTKENLKKMVEKTEKGLKTFGAKILELAEVVKEDTIYGAKIGKLKLKVMDLESKRMKKLRTLGETVYKLVQEEKLQDSRVNDLCQQLLAIEENIRKYQEEIKVTGKKFKKVNF
ncbi:hypothetical protein KAU39_08460 [bacterium]|nr:hypothetical protein [bacterium]